MTDGSRGPRGPLRGITVIEMAGLGPAPYACMLMADLGADLIRVDRPQAGELDAPAHLELVNRGKRSVILDLKRPGGRAALISLVRGADVLIEGNRPGVMERLGLGPDDLREHNPALVYGRMTGWGQSGPLVARAGHDISYIALTGALHAIGERGGPPQVPLNLVGDYAAGSMYLLLGVLAALLEARATGAGQVVDAAIVDGTVSLLTLYHGMLAAGSWVDERGINTLDGGAPFYSVYATQDGRHMAVGALENKFYRVLLEILELDEDPTAQYRRERWPSLRARLSERFASRTQAEWSARFDGSDACVSPVLSMTDAAYHPHLLARGSLLEVAGIAQAGVAPRFSRHGDLVPGAPSVPGANTREVLEVAGVDVDQLIADSVAAESR